jgi:hypothetical protein
MANPKKVRLVAQYRKIDMEQFARVLAMLVEERHRARLDAERDTDDRSALPDAAQER